jgi:hypothetical protein
MTTADETAPMKKPRSEAQVQSLEKARAKARELRTQRNVIREKHGITDEKDATPVDETDETPTDDAETESESASETDEQPAAAAVVEKKPKVEKEKLIKPKTDPAPKPKRQATPYYQPQQKNEHVPVPNQFRMMSRHNYILFDE